jgi:hypothetical protein
VKTNSTVYHGENRRFGRGVLEIPEMNYGEVERHEEVHHSSKSLIMNGKVLR